MGGGSKRLEARLALRILARSKGEGAGGGALPFETRDNGALPGAGLSVALLPRLTSATGGGLAGRLRVGDRAIFSASKTVDDGGDLAGRLRVGERATFSADTESEPGGGRGGLPSVGERSNRDADALSSLGLELPRERRASWSLLEPLLLALVSGPRTLGPALAAGPSRLGSRIQVI